MTDERFHPDDREFRLSRYIDGDLDPDEVRCIEDDLRADAALRRLLGEYRGVDERVKSAAGPVPEPDWERFAQQVRWRCRADREAGRRRALYRVTIPLAAAAALALVFLLRDVSNPRPIAQSDAPTATPPENRSASSTETASKTSPQAVVSVVFDRTPPEGAPEAALEDSPAEESGSYVIAAAGARPLGESAPDEDSTPTF